MSRLPCINDCPAELLAGQLESAGLKCRINSVSWPAFPYCPVVTVFCAHTVSSLLLHYSVQEKEVRAVCSRINDPVYRDSCVECFVRPSGSDCYYNFEFNCLGVHLSGRRTLPDANIFNPPFESEGICVYSSLSARGHKPPLHLGASSWQLSVKIPCALFGMDSLSPGDELFINFHKCGDDHADPHYTSWMPYGGLSPDFHQPRYFGHVLLS